MSKSPITTHVLDTSLGKPASGVAVSLEKMEITGKWIKVGNGVTDDDGRISELTNAELEVARYRITFDIESYFQAQETVAFYPSASVEFKVEALGEHYHVPLLLNPFGYSTYRGS